MTFKEFTKSLSGGEAEGELIKTIFISLAVSVILLGILYFFKLKYVADFRPKYGFFLFLAMLGYSMIIPSVRYVRAYREFTCMSGMMIGMTIGMIAGFLPGYFIGATNGMFWGSMFGMVIGISLGIWNGRCCGVMGVMEGTMAGFMGGLMGAMTAVMMYNDNLRAAGVVVLAISAFILFGLNYMVYQETREAERKHNDGELFVIFWSFVLTVVTIIFMIYGPRSILFT
ncbi:hypothetical protein AUJ84_01090 [Candidatus Pacearchaeota archaeon CG1_02_32_132]|nr:MAG: hypothetical protein AUJ84_01090 [Candidatus Pacearchaeota archaeon CG1_02_32_132]